MDKHVEDAEGLGISTQVMNPEDARKYMDENTIGLIVMFGSTYNGQFEDVVLADKIVGALAASPHPTHCMPLHARAPWYTGECSTAITHSPVMQHCMHAGEVNKKNGWDMRIHVDGASGAMVAPFVFPGLLPQFPHASLHLWA